jgi:hypothetical protein
VTLKGYNYLSKRYKESPWLSVHKRNLPTSVTGDVGANFCGLKTLHKKRRDEPNINFRRMYWLLGRNSEISIHNKFTLYKQVIRPVWSYGIQLWGCASDLIFKRSNTTKTNCQVVLLTHHVTFEIVTFIVISESRRLQISSLSSPSLMKGDFRATSTSKRPDF